MPLLPEGLNIQENNLNAVPKNSIGSIPEAVNYREEEKTEINAPFGRSSIPPEIISYTNPKSLPLFKSNNRTMEKDGIALPGKVNKTVDTGKMSLSSAPERPPRTTSNSNKTSNHSVGHPATAQLSKLLLSVQTVKKAQIPRANVSVIDSVANSTGNHSAVLISNTREIEVVIIANKLPKPAPQVTTAKFQFPVASHAPSRRFPSDRVYPNGTLLGARRRLPAQYASRHYWPVYLTLTLLCLSVLAICVVCCSSQGRRDMSIPPPKPVQYGHQLPPYSYAFSHEMRQADSQETARLNPGSNS